MRPIKEFSVRSTRGDRQEYLQRGDAPVRSQNGEIRGSRSDAYDGSWERGWGMVCTLRKILKWYVVVTWNDTRQPNEGSVGIELFFVAFQAHRASNRA